MPRLYTVVLAGTVTAAGGDTDLCELTPADDHPIRIRGWKLGQYSEVAEAQEEGLNISVIRLPATVTSGSGGSAPTPRPVDSTTPAASFTAEVNNTTVATTSGTAITLEEIGWNLRATPYETWYPDPDLAPCARQGEVLVIRKQTTLADDASMSLTVWVEED